MRSFRTDRRRLTFDSGGYLVADGLLYVVHGRTGEVWLVEATPEAFTPLARAKVLEGRGRDIWAPPALSEGQLLVRDQNELKCLDVREP